jgi:H+-transporting ATPase
MATRRRVVSAFPAKPSVSNAGLQNGLTSDEARRRVEKFGPNAMPDTRMHPLRMALEKFWALGCSRRAVPRQPSPR